MTDSAPKPRPRKLYVLWAIALTLLLALGSFSWLVVVPVLQARTLVRDEIPAKMFRRPVYTRAMARRDSLDGIAKLGGQRRAAMLLYRYLIWFDGHDFLELGIAADMMAHCGADGLAALRALAEGSDKELRRAGVEGLERAAGHDPAAVTVLRELSEGNEVAPGADVRRLAREALKKIKAAQEKKK